MKRLLLFLTVISGSAASAQSFAILDSLNNPVGSTLLFEANSEELQFTKLHIENTTGTDLSFRANIGVVSNPTDTDLQICFVGGCFIIAPGELGYTPPGAEPVLAGETFDDFKIGPFSYPWDTGDSATWMLTIFNEADVDDKQEVEITWKSTASIGVGIGENAASEIKIYPNPTSALLTIEEGDLPIKSLVLSDTKGNAVLEKAYSGKLNVAELPVGVYYLTVIREDNSTSVERVLIR